MGKVELPVEDIDAPQTGIAIRPVLLRKGNTHVGLYGIGNVKDQRLHYELRSSRVRMFMPRDKDDWFNILLLHQNRYFFSGDSLYVFDIPSLLALSMALKKLCLKACLTTALTS